MVELSAEARIELKEPLGKLYKEIRAAKELNVDKRIISVGDICTINLLKNGIKPHLAVFDYRFMRNNLNPQDKKVLTNEYPNPVVYLNPAGSLSDEIIEDAPTLLENGGAILIVGEEDLCALAFILEGDECDLIIYGQPDQGIVVVVPDKEIKGRIRRMLSG
jgi:uncharacterized protein (UPF0218 family)